MQFKQRKGKLTYKVMQAIANLSVESSLEIMDIYLSSMQSCLLSANKSCKFQNINTKQGKK